MRPERRKPLFPSEQEKLHAFPKTQQNPLRIFVKKNIATLADGTIAASVAKMNDVAKNFYENTSATLAETVELVTKNPAKKLNLYEKIGSLEVGKYADFVIFDKNFNIKKTFINGRIFS